MADAERRAKSSDLGVRTASAVAMLALAGTALWLGGVVWSVFVLLVAAGVWFEWSVLVILFTMPGAGRNLWRIAGAVYCGVAAAILLTLRDQPQGIFWVLLAVGAVIGTDVGAYFFGRFVGGPKIAPKISPSKTWAGLFGGIVGASLLVWLLPELLLDGMMFDQLPTPDRDRALAAIYFAGIPYKLMVGALIAITSQTGDFFESWMKRRAGVKDSGKLIPGHGGLFDRVDGLLAVLFVLGLLFAVARVTGAA